MKCPGCGYQSFDLLQTCRKCGARMVATAGAAWIKPGDPTDDLTGQCTEPGGSPPGRGFALPWRDRAAQASRAVGQDDPVAVFGAEGIEVGEDDLDQGLFPAVVVPDEDDGGPPFHFDEDFFSGRTTGDSGEPASAAIIRTWPAFSLAAEEPGAGATGLPIIDRDDEIPEQFWVPEVAGLGRRGVALLVDQALLAVILGVFYLGAFLAFQLADFETDYFLAASGLQAALLPFTLLAALLSLAYHSYFHGTTGCTPGKLLAGVEVRTCDGGDITWVRVILRWAVFEPRRRGWADLLSGTVIARRRRPSVDEVSASPFRDSGIM
jgi:uncharacterized RDD family membrane protein YckC